MEKVFSPHPAAYLLSYVIGGLFMIFGIFVSFLFFAIGAVYILIIEGIRRGNKYYVTNRRAIHYFSFLSRKTSSTMYGNLQDVHFSQGIVERLFGIGSVYLNTAGSHNVEIIFKGVKNPASVKKEIERHLMKRKK